MKVGFLFFFGVVKAIQGFFESGDIVPVGIGKKETSVGLWKICASNDKEAGIQCISMA